MTRATVILLALLAAPCGAAPGRVPVRDVQEAYRRGELELVVDPTASLGDEGSSYAPGLVGRYVVAAIPTVSVAGAAPPLYIYCPFGDDFYYLTTLPGYRKGSSEMAPHAETITWATRWLYPSTLGASAPFPDLRWIRRCCDPLRLAAARDPRIAAVVACVALVVAAVALQLLASAAVALIEALSSALARHRVISHAERLLGTRSTPRRRKP